MSVTARTALVVAALIVVVVLIVAACGTATPPWRTSPYPAPSVSGSPYPGPSSGPTAAASHTVRPESTLPVTDLPGAHSVYLPVILGQGGTEVAQVTPTPASLDTPDVTLTPSATPTPRWPEPLETPGLSKVGLHVIRNDDPDIMEFMRVAKPRLVKAVDDFGYIAEIKQFSPTTVAIGRIMLAEQPMTGDPVATAQSFVAEHLQTYLDYPAVDYWEGYNEPSTDMASMQWYAQFEAERVRVMASYGLRAAVGAFATGTPEFDQMLAFLPAIEAAKQYGGILDVHEYSAPTLDYGMGSPIPGQPPGPDRGVFMLRYRFFYDGIFKPRDLVVPLVISEAGIDGGIAGRPGPEEGLGWRDFTDYWIRHGLGSSGSSIYVDQLAWYDQEVRRDDYVIGFTVFTAGASRMDEWASFDVTRMLTKLARYLVSQVQ